MIPSSFNKVHVDLGAIRQNYELLKRTAGEAAFLAMVKADGYGHGMLECSRTLASAGCGIFGVAELREAVILRKGGITGEIFSMVGFDAADADCFCEYDITPVVYDVPAAEALSKSAVKAGKTLGLHVKVDTGMSRLGVQLDGIDALLGRIEQLPGIKIAGLASHFPCADDIDSDSTRKCYEKFQEFATHVQAGTKFIRHIANSGGTLYFPDTRNDMVRCGISLYGYYPEGRKALEKDGLRPVMSFSTRVIDVKTVPASTGVSYGHTYVTEKPTTLAVLPVGYEDGFSRRLSNCGEVLIRGKRAPVRGRVCMNLCMVDVSEIEGVATGDEVVILGGQDKDYITADEIASRTDTISYEVLCLIGNNNEREYR